MEYYHSLITEKSWQELQSLKKTVDFVLIGGWAVYFYSKALKSKDIDIMVDFDQLSIIEKYYRLDKNERLSKYQATKGEIDIDIYLPHFSQIGIPVEEIINKTTQIEGFKVININYLLALKIFTLADRGRTPKGRKDFLDLISLVLSNKGDLPEVKKIIEKFSLNDTLKVFQEFLQEITEVEELNVNNHQFSKLKKAIIAGLKA
ncbi:MAG: hypothetical protein AAB740_05040 [Patescibacteria group bacterium]